MVKLTLTDAQARELAKLLGIVDATAAPARAKVASPVARNDAGAWTVVGDPTGATFTARNDALRATGRYTCAAHGKNFATAKGLAWHEENIPHTA